MNLKFDIVLPSILFIISAVSLVLHKRYEERIKILMGDQRLGVGEAIIMVMMMGAMVTIVAFMPQQAVMTLFLFSYSLMLYLFTYIIAPKWYLAAFTPALFVVLYFFYWNTYLSNFFAVFFAVSVSIYLGSVLTWKYVAVFVPLLTLLDIVQVWGTKFMGQAAEKLIALQLPALISVWTFPSELKAALGLGDAFLAGLLAIQSTQKYGRKFAFASIVTITVIFSLIWTAQLNFQIRYLPATVPITGGWLAAIGVKRIATTKTG